VIEINKPTETCRQTSDLPGSHSLLTKRLRFLIASALSRLLTRPQASTAVSSKSWLRSNPDTMPTELDEDLHTPNRLESKPSRVSEASANANQDNAVLKEIRITLVLKLSF